MSRALVHNQVSSLACAVVMILGTITIVLRSWKMGVVAAIPNLLPTVMIFGLMGWLGIELSAGTTMIASVALGLFVDDTIHLLYLYRQEKKTGRRTFDAIEYALHHAGRAVIFTSLILTLGFWAGLLGSFKPTLYFSFLMGVIFDYGRVLAWTQHQEPRAAWERRLGLAPGALTRAVHNEHSWKAAQCGTISIDAH